MLGRVYLAVGRPIPGFARGQGIQSAPKKYINSLLINMFGINLNEISISG
jgi:hypothetical protein